MIKWMVTSCTLIVYSFGRMPWYLVSHFLNGGLGVDKPSYFMVQPISRYNPFHGTTQFKAKPTLIAYVQVFHGSWQTLLCMYGNSSTFLYVVR